MRQADLQLHLVRRPARAYRRLFLQQSKRQRRRRPRRRRTLRHSLRHERLARQHPRRVRSFTLRQTRLHEPSSLHALIGFKMPFPNFFPASAHFFFSLSQVEEGSDAGVKPGRDFETGTPTVNGPGLTALELVAQIANARRRKTAAFLILAACCCLFGVQTASLCSF